MDDAAALAGFVDGLRRRAERAIDRALPPAPAALVRGMVLGQDERIDPLVRDDFRDSGLAHLLAVSGQNVMLLAALALPLLGLAGAGPGAPHRGPARRSSPSTCRWPVPGRRFSGRESWEPPASLRSPPRVRRPARTRSCSRRR